MASATDPATAADQDDDEAPFEPTRRKFDVDEYLRMGELGILRPEERVELIDGDIIVMCPIGSRHSGCVTLLTNLLAVSLAGRALVSPRNPLRISRKTEPEPDLMLVRYRRDGYSRSHPTPEDVLFVVEVMETSARYDRRIKLPLYARAGVPEVWLVDLNAEAVEVHRRPAGDRYAETRLYRRGESFAPGEFPDAVVEVDAILGG